MTKSFIYSIWVISLSVFVILAFIIINGLAQNYNPILGQNWTDIIGFFLIPLVFPPVYKLFKLLPQIKIEEDGKKALTSILYLALWFIVPLIYFVIFDTLQCMEASITNSARLPARCYKTTAPKQWLQEVL